MKLAVVPEKHNTLLNLTRYVGALRLVAREATSGSLLDLHLLSLW